MIDVEQIYTDEDNFVINTGSPHFVKFVEDLQHFQVYTEGSKIRNSPKYQEQGINVNFVQILDADSIYVRTYERGVENETYSCGTGVTAAALPFINENKKVKVKTIGGNLIVYAEKKDQGFVNIWLEGLAKQVFKGKISI